MSDQHVQSLLTKLDRWLLQQPEYPILFLGDRKTRRQASSLLGKHVFTLPERQVSVVVNRKAKRQQLHVVRHEVAKAKTRFSKRQNDIQNEARKQRARYQRLSLKRLEQLAAAAVAGEQVDFVFSDDEDGASHPD